MPKSSAQRGKEFRERKGKLAASPVEKVTKKRDGNAIETLLMTAQNNTDFVNHPVPSTSLVRVGTDACESIVNSILRYKDYDSHKNAHKDFQKRFVISVQFVID
ncbi:UNVERIFIED_CONTAM: hypothetical protein NCL1_41461 [Trichonephila clavipes]